MRLHGHRAARIDPLDLFQREEVAALDPTRYGLVDPKKEYCIDGVVWTGRVGEQEKKGEFWSLEKIVQHLRAVYVGNVAYEFMHSISKTERLWFMRELEASGPGVVRSSRDGEVDDGRDVTRKKHIHSLLAGSEVFDRFLQLKFPNLKRYGLEGGESMLVAADALFRAAASGEYAPLFSVHDAQQPCIQLAYPTLSLLCHIVGALTSSRVCYNTHPRRCLGRLEAHRNWKS